jgi:hypothetical protein
MKKSLVAAASAVLVSCSLVFSAAAQTAQTAQDGQAAPAPPTNPFADWAPPRFDPPPNPSPAADATILAKRQADLVAPWIITIQGEAKARGMHIRRAERTSDTVWKLDATYDLLYAKDQTSIKADLTVVPSGYKLELVTQANSLIVAESTDLAVFSGTFKPSSGAARRVMIEKVSAEEFSKRQQAALAQLFVQPGADVPTSCAGFVGRWAGYWPNYGQTSLWVVEVNAQCVAKYAHRSSAAFPTTFQTVTIKDGVLEDLDRQGFGNFFELHTDELWARHTEQGGSNATVFRRIQIGER